MERLLAGVEHEVALQAAVEEEAEVILRVIASVEGM